MLLADQEEFDRLGTRLLSGEASAPEQDRLQVLLEIPEWNERFETLLRIWRAAAGPSGNRFDPEAAGRRLTAAIGGQRKAPLKPRTRDRSGAGNRVSHAA
jgi:hypothetical protein